MNNIISNRWIRVVGAALLLLCLDVRQAYAVAITLGSRIDLTPTTFALPIEIADAVAVSEWFVDLTYDPTDVQVNLGCDPFGGDLYCSLLTGPVTEGDFFAAGAPFNLLVPGFVELDPITFAQAGRLFGMHGAFGGIPPAPSGNGILAYLEFTLLGAGDSPIDLDDTVVSEPVAVPEPGTLALLAGSLVVLGGLCLFTRGRRRLLETVVCLGGIAAALTTGAAYAQTTAPGPYYATPSWNQTLPCSALNNCPRFVVLSNMNGEAVLDRETGVVWERSPTDAAGNLILKTWQAANFHCSLISKGGRRGWRLPTIHELNGLVDPTVPSPGPTLPAGHPFQFGSGTGAVDFWSSTIDATTGGKYYLNLAVGFFGLQGGTSAQNLVWCVRGGLGVGAGQ